MKTLVLDSVSSPITKRVYNMALNEFLAWFQQAPRPGFTKATVSAWGVKLDHAPSRTILQGMRFVASDQTLRLRTCRRAHGE